MEEIKKVIASYGISPVEIFKITDKVHKIDDGQQTYALKKSALTHQRIPTWERTFHRANQQQLSSILPLFITKNSVLYTIYDQEYYYLMPWINGQQASIEQLYRCIGKIHKQTKQLQAVDHKQVSDQFSQYKRHCDDAQEKLLSYVKLFESHTYMSPLELQVCTHYRDIEHVFIKIRNQMNRFINEREDALVWGYSLCHGNLKLSHSIEADQTYLMNWEQAIYEHPITDLVALFKNEVVAYDAPVETFIHSFKVYMNENKLDHDELTLLLIHLLDPISYLTIVQQYIEQTSHLTMMSQIKQLQVSYRQLIFGLQLLDFIDESYLSVIKTDLED